MGYYSIYKIFQDIIRKLFNVKIWKICLIIIALVVLYSNFSKVFAVSSDFDRYFNSNYSLSKDEMDFKTGFNNEYTIKLPDWSYQYFTNIFISFNDNGNTRSGGIWLSKGKIFLETISSNPDTLNIRGEQGKYLYFHRLPIVSGSKIIDMSNISYNDFDITTSGNAYGGFLNTTSYTAIYGLLYDYSSPNDVILDSSSNKLPEIVNTISDLQSLNFDVISVNAWSWSEKDFDILFYDRNVKDTNSTEGLYPKRVITLNQNTSYFQADLTADPNKNAIYWIPIDEIGLNLYVGGTYEIRLAERVPLQGGGGFRDGNEFKYSYLGDPVTFTVSSDVSQDKINAINKEIEDTTNKKYHEETINSINNLNNNINNVNDALTNTTPDSSLSSDIDDTLNFDNQNEGLNNLNGGFFSRLTSMLSNLLGYNLAEDTTISLPLPYSNKSIIMHSKNIYDNVTGALRLIINAFWVYTFSFYMWKFINKIYVAVSSGNILDNFSSSGEAITNDML